MSTSLLHHGFGAFEHRYLETEYEGAEIYFHVEKTGVAGEMSELWSTRTGG